MLWKILFTLLVIGGTIWLKKRQPERSAEQSYQPPKAPSAWQRWSPWGLAVMVLLAALWGFDKYQQGNQILEVKVFHKDAVTTYQVYRKDMEGRRFTTVQGLQVRLGDSERVEVAEQQ